MVLTSVPGAIRAAIRESLLAANLPQCRIDFWDRDQLQIEGMAETSPPLVLRIQHPGVIRALFWHRDPLVLAEAYLNGFFDFSGTLEGLVRFFRGMPRPKLPAGLLLRAWVEAMTLPALPNQRSIATSQKTINHDPDQDQAAIQHHYDVGNQFYRLWLDPHMVYSCAHFDHEAMDLATAQEHKLDLICRKLRLQSGETLLDVGCGWGALLRWAAKHYGVKGYGITLSEQQWAFNQAQLEADGLADRVQVELRDYRDLPRQPTFDKAVSIGMVEHVGLENYPVYFEQVLATLKPGGLFLNHGITASQEGQGTSLGERFINRYIFPNGELVRLSTTLMEAEAAGWEVVDVDGWRPHYAKTLRHWGHNLEQCLDRAVELVGERQARLWWLYLIGSAMAFEENHMGIYQVLLRRQCDRTWNLPLSRADWLV